MNQPGPEEIAQWKQLGVATTSDAMEGLGLRRSVITGLRTTAPDAVAVGPAFTIRQMLKHASASKEAKQVRHAQVIRQDVPAGAFVVMDAGGFDDLSSWGELHSRHCLDHGIAGLLIDGCVRDAAKIRRMGFAAYCRGFSPLKSQWEFETTEVNQPVMIGRVQVRPGDLVIADEDGAIIVPYDRRLDVLAAGLDVIRQEDLHYRR